MLGVALLAIRVCYVGLCTNLMLDSTLLGVRFCTQSNFNSMMVSREYGFCHVVVGCIEPTRHDDDEWLWPGHSLVLLDGL